MGHPVELSGEDNANVLTDPAMLQLRPVRPGGGVHPNVGLPRLDDGPHAGQGQALRQARQK